ncbi:MAG TPA: hypothetical protein VM597_37205, partial [Gemmataceae bacterium]|nr:hypothetical protein [Gemmataceae bacterium]
MTLLFAATAGSPAVAAGPYDDLLKGVSPNTNTLVMVNAKAAYASPLGKAQKWDEKAKKSQYGALGFVPPDAELVVIASEVNLTAMQRDFQVGVMKLRGGIPNMKDLASYEGGTMSEIAGRLVVLSPRDVYITSLAEQHLVAAFPADRQYTSKWLKHAREAKAASVTPFLKKAADAAGDSVLVVAVDMDDVYDPVLIRNALTNHPVMVKYKNANLQNVSKFVAGVQGLTLTADVKDEITGTIRIEFNSDPTIYKQLARDLFLTLVDGYGVQVPGMDKWATTYTDRTMTLTGPLTGPDLQRLLSLFAFPGVTASDSAAKAAGDEFTPTATWQYYEAANAILKDLRSMKENLQDDKDYAKTATWHDKAAAQLDQLNRKGVDPIATQAASDSARRLRAISGSLQGVPIDVDALSKTEYFY